MCAAWRHTLLTFRFIYIENQYFLGSSQFWREHDDAPCHNWVPYALTRRICRAIDEGEKFKIYVLIPLFPEGSPQTLSVQEILHWEYQTMRMMYQRIGMKLKEKQSTAHPHDYLSFYFCGKREPDGYGNPPAHLPTDVLHACRTRRHPIYIHSKMMIIDDEYIVIGSANINERSMGGGRDTEIAFGAIQPAFRAEYQGNGDVYLPRGDIAAFRRALWCEHLGECEKVFEDPASPECISRIYDMTLANWNAYVNEDPTVTLPHGNLCPYPIDVKQDGETGPLPEHPNIPGWTSPVIGARSALLPASLTT